MNKYNKQSGSGPGDAMGSSELIRTFQANLKGGKITQPRVIPHLETQIQIFLMKSEKFQSLTHYTSEYEASTFRV